MYTEEIGKALELFGNYDYERCVELLIAEYDKGEEKEWIKRFLYENFIIPNEEEFKQNFEENSDNMTQLGYEECLIDFVPVSDEKYYLFYKPEERFLGSMVLDEHTDLEQEFHSLLISDTWDLREMIPFLRQKAYQTVYILLEGVKGAFLSFFKIKDIVKRYLDNAILFSGIEEMKAFFIEYPSFYLPHKICSANNEYYESVIDSLIQTRIKKVHVVREDVFLSICIPSYNRGHRALETVKRIQNLPYDAEIEVLVSDNGSTDNTDGYKEIELIQEHDARIRYVRLPVNEFYYGNICSLIANATGEFIMLASDEDIPMLDRMEDCLNYIYKHRECGIGVFSHVGNNGTVNKEQYCDDLFQRISAALNLNYLTGIVIRSDILKNRNAVEILKSNKNNQFVWHYTHIALSLLAAEKSNMFISDIVMWEEGKDEHGYDRIIDTFQAGSRIKQGTDAIDFIREYMRLPLNIMVNLIEDRIWKSYFLIGLAFYYYGKHENYTSWFESCMVIYEGWKKYLKLLSMEEKIEDVLISYNHDMLWEKLKDNPLEQWVKKEEQQVYQIAVLITEYMEHRGKEISGVKIEEILNYINMLVEK